MSHADEGTLHAYLDGELTTVEAAGLEAHLDGCVPCRARLEEARALIERAQGILGRAAPQPRLASGRTGARPLPRWLPLAWAASVLLALGAGWVARGGPSRQATDAMEQILDEDMPSPVTADRARASSVSTADRRDAPLPSAATGPGRGAATPDHEPATAKAEAREEADALARAAEPVAAADAAAPAAALVSREQAPDLAATLVAGAVINVAEMLELDSARRRLAGEVYRIAGLPLVAVRAGDDATVIVEQRLNGGLVRLTERNVSADEARSANRQPAALESTTTERLARYLGSLRIEIDGPVPADSLSRLLERLRPIE